MTSTGYESWETRRDASLRKKASIAADAIAEVQEQIAAQEGGLNEALEQARLALEIVNDPNGPVQQAVSESAAARDEARDAVTAVEAATEDVAEALAAADEAVTQASLAKTTADGKNKIYRAASADDFPLESELTPGDLLYFINPATFGEVFEEVLYVYVWDGEAWGIYQMVAGSVLVPSSVGTISLADGAVTAPKVIAGAITTEKLQAGAVDTSKLQAGAVTTEKLDAGSVTAAKMVIAENDNLIPDPNFAGFDSDGSSWVTSDGGWYVSRSDDTAVLRHQGPYGGDWIIIRSQEFVVSRGDDLLVRCDWINSLPRAAKIGIMYFDSLGEAAGSSMVESSATGWQKTVIETTVPENARTAYFRYAVLSPQAGDSGATMFGRPQVLRRASGELIVDGAITARKIQAGAITTEKLQAGAVDTSKLQAGAVTTEKLDAGSVTAAKMVIAENDNLIPDPNFAGFDSDGSSWVTSDGGWYVSRSDDTAVLRHQGPYGGDWIIIRSQEFVVSRGDDLLVRCDWINSLPRAAKIGIMYFDSLGEAAGSSMVESSATGWQKTVIETTVPENARTAYFRYAVLSPQAGDSGATMFGRPQVLRRASGELIVDGAITARKIQAGAITAEKIQAGAVNTSKLTVGDFTNLVDDPDFMNPSESWGLPSTVTVVDTTGGPGKALRFTPTGGGSNYAWNGNVFPVKQGDRFLLAARVQNAFNTGNLTVGIQFLDEGEVSINDAGSMAFGISGWADKSTEVVVPADAFYGRFYAVEPSAATSGDAWVSKPRVLRMSTGEMIVNGSISTDKLDARAVTADKIATRNIYAGHISAGTITANEINTGSIRAEILKANVVKATHIDADAINGKTITGATIQSKSPSGSTYPARSVVMSPTGVDVFGSNAIQVTRIDYRGIYATPSNGSGMYPVRPTFAGTAKRSSPGSVTVSAIITSGTPISVTAGPNCTARITARSADTFTINIQKYDTSSFVNSYEAYWMAAP
ncbi:MAG: hypothetical protein ACTH4Y_08010 [Microbacterium gubbeenense]|uniref:hypothetical protein n=1 Tax=Microbacterium gubbeenense TaxID=159896 RepID=UPI003F94E7B7